jgi:hypothetical protein
MHDFRLDDDIECDTFWPFPHTWIVAKCLTPSPEHGRWALDTEDTLVRSAALSAEIRMRYMSAKKVAFTTTLTI